MNYYYVTGTSRGIGKAVVEELLAHANNIVYGISRNHTIEHKNYHPIALDLNDVEAVKNFHFEELPEAEKIVLVNNAGVLGHVAQVGKMYSDKIVQSYNVNLVSPTLLINQFMRQFQDYACEKILLNTSSGAARHTIPSWSTYCATKTGIEMFFGVIQDEQQDFDHPFKVYSVAPGVVDTEMQDEIREVEPENFRELDRFIQLKKEGLLVDPKAVGKKFVDILEHPGNYPKTLMDLRD